MANVRKKAATKERIDLSERLRAKLLHNFSVQPEAATMKTSITPLALVLRDLMRTRRLEYIGDCYQQQSKQVYYLCMEFLMGRSLKNTLYNLNLTEEAERVLSSYGVKLDALYELEPDAGLGKRRPGTAGRLLPGRPGHQGYPGHGIFPAVRIRHFPSEAGGRLADRAARLLASRRGKLAATPAGAEQGGPL